MKAIRYYGPRDIRIENIDTPHCTADEIRARIDACAVCGTDLKAYFSGNPRIKAPQVMGHEFTGVVDVVGDGVSGFSAGDRVVMATSISCGNCYYCGRNRPNLCVELAPMGFTYAGGMAEYVTIPAKALARGHVVKVPEGVKAVQAALAEPLSCTVNAAENSQIAEGDTVLVVGAGPMGIMNACMAKKYGAAKIILSEINPKRLNQAREFGFDVLVDSSQDDLRKVVLKETNGLGADVVLVAAPVGEVQSEAVELVRKRGTVCLFASLPVEKRMISVDSRLIHYREVRVIGTSDSTPEHVKKAVDLIAASSIPVKQLASHTLPLDGIFEAFELMKSGEALRVVLTP